ncbi:hypothetical protein Tco_0722524 [Tanacetum coccineum]
MRPTAVLTKSGLVSISTARQSSSRAAALIGTAMPIKTAAPKPFVNVVKSRPNAFQKSHSPSKRSFYQHTTLKNRNLNNRVNIVKVNSVNTAKGKSVISAIGEQEINAVKSKECWVWRPKIKVLDHVSKNYGSYIYKQFDYVDPTGLEYDFDLTEQQLIPLKAQQVEEQSQEMFKAELSVLSVAKILTKTSKERVKTYNRRRRSTDSSQVSTAAGLFSTAEDIQYINEELAKKVQEEEQTKVLEQQEQERANLEAALNLQK